MQGIFLAINRKKSLRKGLVPNRRNIKVFRRAELGSGFLIGRWSDSPLEMAEGSRFIFSSLVGVSYNIKSLEIPTFGSALFLSDLHSLYFKLGIPDEDFGLTLAG